MRGGRSIFLSLLLCVPSVLCQQGSFCCRKNSHKTIAAKMAFAGLGVISIVGLFHWFRKPEKFRPSVDNLNTVTVRQGHIATDRTPTMAVAELVKQIHRGKMPERACVPLPGSDECAERGFVVEKGLHTNADDNTIVIFSRGYANGNRPGKNDNFIQRGACATAAYRQSRDYILNDTAPTVLFDYPDRRRAFSFGQKSDTDCLRTVYRAVRERNPNANIVLVGNCRGAKTVLDLCADRPEQVKAVLLMSPFMSAKDMTHSIARHHLKKLPRSPDVLYGFFKFWFPNYDEQQDNVILSRLLNIDPDLPILIGHRKGDALIPDHQMEALVSHIRSGGHRQIQLFTVDDTTFSHDRLNEVPAFQWAANAFMKRQGMPHYERLAARGDLLLPPPGTYEGLMPTVSSQRVAAIAI